MNSPSTAWKTAVSGTEGHSIIEPKPGAPLVVHSPLNLPEPARAYAAQVKASDMNYAALRARGAHSHFLNVDGWYSDPSRSTDARLKTANGFDLLLAPGNGKADLIDHMTGTFAELAAAWNRRELTLWARAEHNKDDKPHIDLWAEYVAIANVTNISTAFAPPWTYEGQQPHYFTPPGADESVVYCEYKMTPQMLQSLEGSPAESLTSWRGANSPAVHLVPRFEGARFIMLANTRPGSSPALT